MSPKRTSLMIVALVSVAVNGASVNAAEQLASDQLMKITNTSFYCGCSIEKQDGSLSDSLLDLKSCGFETQPLFSEMSDKISVHHIVPPDWQASSENAASSGRNLSDDLHNLVLAESQISAYRGSAFHGYAYHADTLWGRSCAVKYRGTPGKPLESDRLEPLDCKKGDVARVWLYAHQEYGVELGPIDLQNFKNWSDRDPVSFAEKRRHDLIESSQGWANPFVASATPSKEGSCSWE